MEEIKEKQCTKCGEVKSLSDYYKRSDVSGGYKSLCKLCYNHNNKKYENTQNKKEYRQKYYNSNKQKIKKYNQIRYIENKEIINSEHKKYRDNNKDKIRDRMKKYRYNNKDKIKEYCDNNKDNRSKYHKNYIKNRRLNKKYRIIDSIRTRTYFAVKYNNLSKESSTMKMLGCDKDTLMNHLQSTGERYDPNFNIYDYDSSLYHIDHIKTFADVAKGIYTLEEVCHYTNLQILPAEMNLSKSGTSW